MSDKKTLFFEGVGWRDAEISKATIGNCNIHTAFHLNDGRAIYLGIVGYRKANGKTFEYRGWIDFCHYITDDVKNDDCNNHRLAVERGTDFPYTQEAILEFVNGLGCSFDAIKVAPHLSGYHVFPKNNTCNGPNGYYYGDAFEYDPVKTARRKAVYDEAYRIEEQELIADKLSGTRKFVHATDGKIHPSVTLWVDEFDTGLLHWVRHYNGYNRHWGIRIDQGNTLVDWMSTATETELGEYGC